MALMEIGSIIISIHAPREGGDGGYVGIGASDKAFQSTPPARGATRSGRAIVLRWCHFNPRPPRGGRRLLHSLWPHMVNFNPRPPRGGRPTPSSTLVMWTGHFNPRPPRGGRPDSDATMVDCETFQSTPPARGATRAFLYAPARHQIFQSTPPARGATVTTILNSGIPVISIHAPREGGDIHSRRRW